MNGNWDSFGQSVITPAFQAAITGSLTGLMVGSAAAAFECPLPVELGLTIGSGAALIAWLDYRHAWRVFIDRLYDIDQAPMIIEQQQTHKGPIRVEVTQDQGHHTSFIDLPARPEQLRALADGLLAGKSFSQAVWTGQGAPFSRSEFESLRGELIRRQLAKWKNENAPEQGVMLLASGRAVIKAFATEGLHSPTLQRSGQP